LEPMPSASDRTATIVTNGVLNSVRKASLRFCIAAKKARKGVTCRTAPACPRVSAGFRTIQATSPFLLTQQPAYWLALGHRSAVPGLIGPLLTGGAMIRSRWGALASTVFAAGALAAQRPVPTDLAPRIDKVFSWFDQTSPGCAVGLAKDGHPLYTHG